MGLFYIHSHDNSPLVMLLKRSTQLSHGELTDNLLSKFILIVVLMA